jgi:hypothetical protein
VDAAVERRHLQRTIGLERGDQLADGGRIDQRLVTLHVDDDVGVQRRRDFGEAIGAGLVRRFREPHLAAEVGDARGDAEIVGGDDDLRDERRRRGAAVDVLDHRPAVEVRERFAGESRRCVSCGDDCDDVEWRKRIDFRTSRCRVHGE